MATQEISQVVMDASTVTTIANNINSLYSNAIDQLTSYTLGVVALVGILIPVLVTLTQWRSLKAEKESLEKRISDEITNAKSTIRTELEAEMKQLIISEESSLLSRIEEKFQILENKIEIADASSFHIQGNSHITREYYAAAMKDFCSATKGYLSGGDELNGPRTLRLLIEECLPKILKSDFEDADLEEELSVLISFLKRININNRYDDAIARLNREMKAAKLRESGEA